MNLRYVASPVIGGVIGYFTNYLAVKMLFLPRHEIRVFGRRLPFTPGAIPKGKARLSHAVGSIVSSMLLTKDDLSARFSGGEIADAVAKKAILALEKPMSENILVLAGNRENLEEVKSVIADSVAKKIMEVVKEADFARIIEDEGVSAVKEKVAGSMLAMFVNEDLIRSFIQPLGEKMREMIDNQGFEKIRAEVLKTAGENEEKSFFELAATTGIPEEKIKEKIELICQKTLSSLAAEIAEKLDIARLIEDKMNAMDVMELEKLVLDVMKKELDTIVNLGALIGAILGTINIFF